MKDDHVFPPTLDFDLTDSLRMGFHGYLDHDHNPEPAPNQTWSYLGYRLALLQEQIDALQAEITLLKLDRK